MSRFLLVLVLVFLAIPTAAMDDWLTAQAPEKTDNGVVPPPADPEVFRQGGDTIEDATVIDAIPYESTGTTAGYTDDYDEVCPYDAYGTPDVVYTFTPANDVALDIDLCGSDYDTKLYVYDSDLNLVACNDDFYYDDVCGVYVSFLGNVALDGGMQYYIVIDGYGGDFGDYFLSINEYEPCVLVCPPEGFLEGEPDIVDGYEDAYNGGCQYPEFGYLFQSLNFGPSYLDFCGVAGWYLYGGGNYRDTDWFTAVIGETGFIEITANAESMTNVFELWIEGDCEDMAILQTLTVNACSPGTMTIVGDPGTVVYPWVSSSQFSNPGDVDGNAYDYILTIDGLEGTATQATTWSHLKGLYR